VAGKETPMKVRLCDKNKGKDKVAKQLEKELPELDVKIKKCIDICGDCGKGKVARVDGKKVVADDADELVKKIVKSTKKK
jgi:uncharacterized protein YuzB (UPF0349 family)